MELITTYQVDGQGRTTEETSPAGNVTYTVYNDMTHEQRTYPGFINATGTATSAGTTTTLTATSLSTTANYVGCTITITAGTDSGADRDRHRV